MSRSESQSVPTAISPEFSSSLVLAAEFFGRRFVVRFGERPVALPYARYRTLLSLVEAKLKRFSGLAGVKDFDVAGSGELLYQTIRRLRLDFDASLGAGTGKALINALGSCTYRLEIAKDRIVIDPSLVELVPTHLSIELVKRLIDSANA